MSASLPLYHTISQRIQATTAPARLPLPSVRRLALLVTGLVAAQSTVLARIAAELFALNLTAALTAEHIGRRLRRTLSDPLLIAEECYQPLLRSVIAWPSVAHKGRIIVAIDEGSKEDLLHLFRASLPYWGNAVPLVWTIWEQNVPLPEGAYWAMVDAVLARLATLLPADLPIWIVADRFYAIAPFLDRLTAYGWHWAIRTTTTGSHRFRDRHGREWALKDYLARRVGGAGQQWKGGGWMLKQAGWRRIRLVACWGAGEKEALVVITDGAARWQVLETYARRFWIEPGFRSDKTRGWQWEESRVQGLAHHAVLLLAMAWASLLALCLGVAEAQRWLRRLAARQRRGRSPQPRHARESLFTLGLTALRACLYGRRTRRRMRWHLPQINAPSWYDRWHEAQSLSALCQTVRP
ncbi:MAG: transposase [Thermomicrobiales bacterium]